MVTRRLGLLGASVTQHPQFNDLLQWLDQDRFDDTRVSVSSVRAATDAGPGPDPGETGQSFAHHCDRKRQPANA